MQYTHCRVESMNLVYCLTQGSYVCILLVSTSIGCCGPVYFVKLYAKHYE